MIDDSVELKPKDDDGDEEMARDGLSTVHVVAYTVGHFCNDLCAAMWFFYLAWYLQKVVGLPKEISGFCMLSGQIADGISTPIVGVASDKCNTRCGKRWPWFLFGTLLVIPCFAGIFAYPNFVNTADMILDKTGRYAWYITLPALFNVGWASV